MSRKYGSFWGVVVAAILAAPSVGQAQMFFEASWLQMRRDQDGSAPFITGPESVSPGRVDFDSAPGYRLILGGGLGDYQIDASFSQLDTWQGSRSGVFAAPVLFGDASIPGNTLVPPHGLALAAQYVGIGVDETTEDELLQPGATYSIGNRANYKDFEVNFGGNRDVRRWRVSVGYRHIRLDERSVGRIGGIFDAPDANTGLVFGQIGNLPNDGLSHDALEAAGFVLIGGLANGFHSFDSPGGPDRVDMELYGAANNELNGAQMTFGLRIFDGAWFSLEGIGKAGIYRNNVNAVVQETVAGSLNDDSAYRRLFRDGSINAAFAGNLGLKATIGVTDYINIVGGYEVLFLSGVALSADQTQGLRVNTLGETVYKARTNGSVVAHGGNLGLELLW